MTSIPVNEVFQTLQGEARFTGTPALFIRLQGCPVGCPWCDTKGTWALDRDDEVPEAAMLSKPGDLSEPSHARLTPARLVELALTYEARHVVITGGEPCVHDLTELTERLIAEGRSVQIETSGTHAIRVARPTWVTLSPKLDMPGGLVVRHDAVVRADEIKMPVGRQADVDRLLVFLAEHDVRAGPSPVVWLQPLSRSPKATALCIEAATRHGFNVSIQVHAFIGVR